MKKLAIATALLSLTTIANAYPYSDYYKCVTDTNKHYTAKNEEANKQFFHDRFFCFKGMLDIEQCILNAEDKLAAKLMKLADLKKTELAVCETLKQD